MRTAPAPRSSARARCGTIRKSTANVRAASPSTWASLGRSAPSCGSRPRRTSSRPSPRPMPPKKCTPAWSCACGTARCGAPNMPASRRATASRSTAAAPPVLGALWQRRVASWADATDPPAPLRAALEAELPLTRLELGTQQVAQDGTEKVLWNLGGGEAVESVLIPEGKRRTLCISSQEGCALGCVFCATGRMGFRRNLGAAEIAGQVREIVLRDGSKKPTNVVFMGMGEPLLTWHAVATALTILHHPP